MPELNADFPLTRAFLRAEYLYDLQRESDRPLGVDTYEDVYVFGVTSITGRAVMFHVLTSGGGMRDHVPISALCSIAHQQHWPLDNHELWNCFSYDVSVTEFSYLEGLRCEVKLRDRTVAPGSYIATVDWYASRIAEDPGEGGHKSAHVVALDCGCWVAYPNNRILWREPSFITNPYKWDDPPKWKLNTHKWNVEQRDRWVTEDSDAQFYEGDER